MRTRPSSTLGSDLRRRGIAMLLVMIALVVGTLLTAGFLSTQGTAIGIAYNQRDQDRCRMAAESGIDLCMWLVNNRTDWRRTMTPGNWLSNYPLAGGTVTVVAADDDGTGNFVDNNTRGVTFTSTATVNGRTYTVQACMTPTGGGTPWAQGAFSQGKVLALDNAWVDSYTSSAGSYAWTHGASAMLATNSTASDALTVRDDAVVLGSFQAGPGANTSGVMLVSSGVFDDAVPPSSVSAAAESRTIGQVVGPNLTGFSEGGTLTKATRFYLSTDRYNYDAITLNYSFMGTECRINHDAAYRVRGNLTINSGARLIVEANSTVVMQVDGTVSVAGGIVVGAGSRLYLYCGGLMDAKGSSDIGSPAEPSRVVILGLPSCGEIRVQDTATMAAAVLAPGALANLGEDAVFYGSIVSNGLTVAGAAQLHQDRSLQSFRFGYMTGGSFMGDYDVRWGQ